MPDRRKEPNRMQRIDRIIGELAKLYNYSVTEMTFEIYQHMLAQYPLEDVEAAFKIYLGSYGDPKFNFFPKPNQIIEIIENERIHQKRLMKLKQAAIPEVTLSPEDRRRNIALIREWKKENLSKITKRIGEQEKL